MKLLVPVDGSEPAREALRYALETFSDPSVTVLNVRGGAESRPVTDHDEWEARQRERAEEVFGPAREIAAEHGAEIETAMEHGEAAKRIVAYTEEHDVDAIVMGTRGREGASRLLLGSVAETVVRRAPVPVTVVR